MKSIVNTFNNFHSLVKFFPFEKFRDNQKETLEKIVKLLESGVKVIIVRAPVGFGKSPVGITIGKMQELTYYITPQKILQNQLGKDFTDNDFAIVKGRGNFDCLVSEKERCDYGYCISEGIKNVKEGDEDKQKLSSYCKADPSNLQCPYKLQRDIGAETKICNMNFAYFIVANREIFLKRNLLIVDEAHVVPDWALNFKMITISNKDLYEMKKIPKYEKFEEYIKWLNDDILPIIERRMNDFTSHLSKNDSKLRDNLEKLALKIQDLKDDYRQYKEDWVWEIEQKDRYDSIKFQPITIGRFMDNMMWSRSDVVILMSGTILDPEMFLEEIGKKGEKYEVITVPSNFHYQYNPVLYYPIGKMSKDFKDQTLPKMVDKIKEIIEKHGDEKGIIHCHTYDIANYIYQNLFDIRHRVILQKRENREYALEKFINSKNGIFISINMIEGIDLKDDLARYQIMMKVPYPFLGDKRIAKRVFDRGEEKWYNLQAVEAICQLWGRAQRNEEDWAKLYILDESFESLWNRYKNYFTIEFINSYMYGNYLKLCDDVKILP